VSSFLAGNQRTVKALAGVEQLKLAVEDPNPLNLERANAVLDHFRATLMADACYLLENTGTTIASSNRNDPDSFVGHNYAFRGYFQQAIQGVPDIYMALGVTSNKRGIYYSHPVYHENRAEPIGVVVIKAMIDSLEEKLQEEVNQGIGLLTSPQGVIFASSRQDWLYHTLNDLPSQEMAKIKETRQFGDLPLKWIGLRMTSDDRAMSESGVEYHVYRMRLTECPGWEIVYLADFTSMNEAVVTAFMRSSEKVGIVLCVLIAFSVLLLHRAASADITRRKLAEDALKDSARELRLLSARLLTAQEEERKRIAHELHDSIGGALSAIKYSLEKTGTLIEEGTATPDTVRDLSALTQQTIEEARRIYMDLHPSMLEDLGVIATIGWFCRQYQSVYGWIQIEKEVTVEECDIPETLKIVIFRVMQEALHNIAKHTKASLVRLTLAYSDDSITFSIVDNGAGFDSESILGKAATRKGLGLTSMRERVGLSGGSLSIESAVGSGTTIRASWDIRGLQ
jgi:signal transduction histidine kinase